MAELFTIAAKYALVVLVYIFIFKIVRLIYTDIRLMSGHEAATTLMPHLRLMTPITIKGGQFVSDLYPLIRPETLIGRSKYCLITLPDPFVSSEHVRIEKNGKKFFVEDLKSANGTLLNGEKLEKRIELKDGDRISLGHIDFVYSEGGR